LELWIKLFWIFAIGYWLGKWQNHRYRRDKILRISRRLQLQALSLELKSLRQKLSAQPSRASRRTPPYAVRLIRRRPNLPRWQRWLLALLHQRWPWLMRHSSFRPMTIIGWLRRRSTRKHADKIAAGKRRGRPAIPAHIVEAVIRIARECPRYGAAKIAGLLKGGELSYPISKESVRQILKTHGIKPRPKGKRQKPREAEPSWQAALYNHTVWAMDFKTVFDVRGNMLYIFNIIDHGRRKLIWSRATLHPTSAWVAQQLREAVGWEDPPETIVLDRDSSFLPVVRHTLPALGIKPRRIGYKCPWQNAVVERFHRTLQEELLDFIVPINVRHVNRLLGQYQQYYNTARPHMANGGYPPVLPGQPANDSAYSGGTRKIETVKWLGGLHNSYRWAS